jgi:DNA-binding beta-propeller fold protein YncE
MSLTEYSQKPAAPATGSAVVLPASLRIPGCAAPAPLALALLALLALAFFLAFTAGPASADSTTRCSGLLPPAGSSCVFAGPKEGSAAGQVRDPVGVAVDRSTGGPTSGDVYVADQSTFRIDVFDSTGRFLRAFGLGVRDGAGELQTCTAVCGSGGQSFVPTSIAVDPTTGAVYVSNERGPVEEKYSYNPASKAYALDLTFGTPGSGPGQFASRHFLPLAVDSSGDVWVGDKNRAEKFGPEGEFLAEVGLPATAEIQALAVDAAGDFYAIKPAVLGINEEQVVLQPSSGTYTLTFKGQTTAPIAWNALKGEIRSALEALPSIGLHGVGVEGAFDQNKEHNIPVKIEFQGALSNTDVEQLTATGGATVETTRQGKPEIPSLLSKFSPAGTLLETLDAGGPFGNPNALALDPASGNLFVSDQFQPTSRDSGPSTLLEFDPSGALTEAFGAGELIGNPVGNSLAFFGGAIAGLYVVGNHSEATVVETNGEVTLSNEVNFSAGQIVSLPEPGPLPGSGTSVAREIQKLAVALCAKVNPEGQSSTAHFQYITDAKFKADGESFGSGTGETFESSSIGADFSPHEVCQSVSSLQPATAYWFRIVATNSNAPAGIAGETASFETLPPAAIDSTSVTEVASTSATLQAEINPLGDATSYRFEYLTEAEFQANGESFSGADQAAPVPVPDASLGAGSTDVSVSQHLQGLIPDTVYRFRALISNAVSASHGGPFAGPARAFTTQVGGPTSQFALPDHRAYELVSPPDKPATLIQGPGGGSIQQAAAQGAAIDYGATAPTEAEVPGFSAPLDVLSVRGAGGTSSWSSRDLTLPHTTSPTGGGALRRIYSFFSADLHQAGVQPLGNFEPSLSPQASESTAFLQITLDAADPSGFCTFSCFRPLVTGCPQAGACAPAVQAAADVPPGTKFGQEEAGQCHSFPCGPVFETASSDAAHIVLSSKVGLTETPGDEGGVYEFSATAPPAAALRLLSVLPDGEPAPPKSAPVVGSTPFNQRNTISADGSRVVWSEPFEGKHHIYLRFNATAPQSAVFGSAVDGSQCTEPDKACTVELDALQGGTGFGAVAPVFQFASADGSRVLFTDLQQLTPGSGAQGTSRDLYEYDLGAPAGQRLTDLTPETPAGEAGAAATYILGASEDASYVYFLANGALTPGAVSGDCPTVRSVGEDSSTQTCNLYLRHAGATTLVAVLSGEDRGNLPGQPFPQEQATRASADGRWLAFMSQRPLTGYDSRDARTGRPDQEVFLYHAAAGAGEAGSLVCASCNPSGARPHGAEFLPNPNEPPLAFGGLESFGPTQGIAANLPAWSQLHQPRYLSNSGRLFFDSSDALLPQDSNATQDVYQYEPPGVGDCTQSSATFARASAGCVGLISSGTSPEESVFFDANESGDDAFFLTTAQLTSSDADTSFDVYDARVGGGFPQPVRPVECSGDACQPFVAAPNDPTPGSLTFQGPGNLLGGRELNPTPPSIKKTTKTVKCKKPKKLSHGKCVKPKSKKRKTKRARKASHNRRAGR